MSIQDNPLLWPFYLLFGRGEPRKPARPAKYLVAVFVLLVAVAGTYILWRKYSSQILSHDDYRLTRENIQLTDPPKWISSVDEIKQDVLNHDTSLLGMNLNDRQLTERIHDAFEMHPWIKRVEYVGKGYGRVDVNVQYCRPVAMVEVVDEQGKPGIVPVDESGFVLPTRGFSHELARSEYVRINVQNAYTPRKPGELWGDDRVHDCARIAAAVTAIRQELDLGWVEVDKTTVYNTISYRLRTKSGALVIWGQAPGREWRQEPSLKQKLERLLIESKKGPLDPNRILDLSQHQTNGLVVPAARRRNNVIRD